MRPIRSAALPARLVSAACAGGLLVLVIATQAEASSPTELAAAASTPRTAPSGPFAAESGAGQPALFSGPGQAVSDAATPDGSLSAAGRATAASRSAAPAELGTSAITLRSGTERVLALQLRLRWVGIAAVPASGVLDDATTAAVARFQAKHELPPTGHAGPDTLAKLTAVSRRGAALDPRCLAVPVAVCVDKTHKVLRYVRDGEVVRTLDANFGPERGEKGFGTYSRTREGSFTVYRRHAQHTSTGYGTPMRWSLFFDGAEAMHYSDYFRRGGYSIRSFGCVDIASADGAQWVYEHSPVGTPFIVYH